MGADPIDLILLAQFRNSTAVPRIVVHLVTGPPQYDPMLYKGSASYYLPGRPPYSLAPVPATV